MGAVGPDHFMEVINGEVSIFQKSDGTRIASEPLSSFFQHEGGDYYYADPRVLFDQHSRRWIVIAPDFEHSIAVAVSQSDDPMGTFCKSSFVASAGADTWRCVGGSNDGDICTGDWQCPGGSCHRIWPDYPTLGVDANGIYIGADMIGADMIGSGRALWAIDKGPLIVDPLSTPTWGRINAWRRLPVGTIQPAHTYGTPGWQYIIAPAEESLWTMRIYRIDSPVVATPTPTPPTMSTWTISLPQWHTPRDSNGDPLYPPALDSSLAMINDRLMMSVYRDGSLWTTHSIDVNGRWGIRWYQIDLTYPPPYEPVIKWGNVGHPTLPLHFYMPSLMVNRAGHVALAFSGSDASTYVSAYYTGRRASDPNGEMAVPQLLKAGEGPYTGRLGDYSYTTLDPVDESTIWTIQEYAAPLDEVARYRWGTWIAALGPFGICNDNNGNSPLVCVDWDGELPPVRNVNFTIDTISDSENPNATLYPNVTFVTGNDEWNVWSQVSRSDATQANLGHIKIDPDAGSIDNFGVTVAHGASPGAANVASIALVKTGWTGESNLPAGRIAGDLTGDLALQGTPGQSGAASFTIDGSVSGNVNIPTVDTLQVNGAVSPGATITIGGFVGEKRAVFNSTSGDFAGDLFLSNGIPTGASVQIGGVMNGNLCATNISASQPLPSNVTIGCGIGTTGTICGYDPVCAPGDILEAFPPHGTRDGRQPHPATNSSISARQGLGSPNPDARPEDKITMTLNTPGLRAISHDCWALCETWIEPVDTGTPALSANKISCIKEDGLDPSKYEVRLERPISAKNWTTIKYVPGSRKIAYASLPGNINGDNYVNSTDLLRTIDCMNGQTSQCGTTIYTQDLDHSGAFVLGPDYGMTFGQLWTGESNFIPWQGMTLPPNTCQSSGGGGGGGGNCTSADCGQDPGPMSMAMTGGGGVGVEAGFGEEPLVVGSVEAVSGVELFGAQSAVGLDENAQLADWLVNFLVEADPADSYAQDIFDMSLGMLTQWCLDHFSAQERAMLVQRLTDPGLTFACDIGAGAAEGVVAALAQ
jgi:hypothetical protein